MAISISFKGNQQIKDINEAFTGEFPFLKFEFYSHTESKQEKYTADKVLSPETLLKDVGKAKKEEGLLEIQGNMTVLQLEKVLSDKFGLAAQVFRKSGRVWLQTIRTDNWTLDQQNKHGQEITDNPITIPVEDYDLNPGN